MQQFLEIWRTLDTRRRVVVGGSTILVVLGVLFLTRMASTPNMDLLYSGLSPAAAGEVISQLEAEGVPYEVRGGSIFVDEVLRDQLRLTLASSGIPANVGDGYELLDNLSGFGTTSQMFDAAYLRAKEGELGRTIVANPQINSARVHIAQADRSPFRDRTTPTASVSLRGDGTIIPDATADAIRYLVASAVAGMEPADVSIINADLGVVMAQAGEAGPTHMALEHGARLKQNVERLIVARTGIGGAVVEVNVDTLTEEELLVERKVDPDSRVAISTNTQETSSSSRNQGGGAVTVASNLPEGDTEGGGESSDKNTDSREIVNYEVSETTRELRRMAGSIKRITVAVLVDGTRRVDDTGTEIWEPRSDAELAALEELVKSAVGFDEARGDSVTLRSMDLIPDPALAESSENGWVTSRPLDIMSLAKIGIAAAVVLVLGLFVVRPILTSAVPPLLPEADMLRAPNSGASLDGEISGAEPFFPTSAVALQQDPSLKRGQLEGPQDPVERLKSLIDERQEETVEVLKSWIETPEEVVE